METNVNQELVNIKEYVVKHLKDILLENLLIYQNQKNSKSW